MVYWDSNGGRIIVSRKTLQIILLSLMTFAGIGIAYGIWTVLEFLTSA